jgi:hypothetical protein
MVYVLKTKVEQIIWVNFSKYHSVLFLICILYELVSYFAWGLEQLPPGNEELDYPFYSE